MNDAKKHVYSVNIVNIDKSALEVSYPELLLHVNLSFQTDERVHLDDDLRLPDAADGGPQVVKNVQQRDQTYFVICTAVIHVTQLK